MEFIISAVQSLTISTIPVDEYTVTEITNGGDMDIGIFHWNSQGSTASGSAVLQPNSNSTIKLKNYYNETYTPDPSDFDVKENLKVNKTWSNLPGHDVSDDDEIQIKISVKSEEAYIPVMLKLYDGTQQLNSLSKNIYVPSGSNVAFTMQRGGDNKEWRRVLQNCNVPMYSSSGMQLKFKNTVPSAGSASTGGSNPTDNPVTYTACNISAEYPVEYKLQPWKEQASWVEGSPTEQGQFSMSFSVSNTGTSNYFESVTAMRDALISDRSTTETLVYTMKKGTAPSLDTERSSSSIRPEQIIWTQGTWTALLKGLPTYERIETDGVKSYRVYSYEIEEIKVNGKTVTDGKTDDYQVVTTTQNPVTGEDGVVTTTTDISNTEMSIPVKLIKTDDQENSTNYLPGAVFELNYKKSLDASWQKASKIEITQLNDLSQFTIPGNANGITLTGLKAGYYQLTEIAPPSGYVITEGTPVVFEVKRGGIADTTGTIQTVTYQPATVAIADDPTTQEDESSPAEDASFTIPNTPGVALPSTGGPGTNILYLLGSLMLAFGSAGFVLRKRRRVG